MVSWSTGEDSAWCLHVLRAAGDVEVTHGLDALIVVRRDGALYADVRLEGE